MKEVAELLVRLELPAQPERLQAISRRIGARFKSELASAASGNSRSALYIRTIIKSISPDVLSKVSRVTGEEVLLDHLVVIADEDGGGFTAMLESAINGQTDAINYIKRAIAMCKQTMNDSEMSFMPGTQDSSELRKRDYPKPASNNSSRPVSMPPASRQFDVAETAEREYKSVHIYGTSTAICFSVDVSRSGKAHVIRVEGAKGSNRSFNWANKISIQLTLGELTLVAACLLGYIDSFAISAHGDNNDKFASIERQQGHFFFSVWQRDSNKIGAQLTAVDLFQVTALLYEQIRRNVPKMSDSLIRDLIRNSAELQNAKHKTKLAA